MFMYICLDCEKIFDFPELWTEKHGLDNPPYEEWWGCPYCGGMYVEAIYCDRCTKPIIGDYVHIITGENICEDCFTFKNIED
jgi:hypothetical protein